MPSTANLLLFSATAIVLLIIPGPAVVYIVARSAAQGRRAGAVSVVGIHTGTVVHVVAATAGLSALLVTSAAAFTVVKYLGAAYLIYLGLRTIRRRHDIVSEAVLPARSLRRLYADGVVVNVFNPKTALFFLAFLPQFVHPGHGPVWSQTLLLGALFIALGVMSDGTYAMAGAGLGRWIRRHPRVRTRGPLVEGGLLIGLGVAALAVPEPHVVRTAMRSRVLATA